MIDRRVICSFAKATISLAAVLFFAWSFPATAQTLANDRDALFALYDATHGDNWNDNTNWDRDSFPDNTWHGITVSGSRVTEVSLYGNNLVGTIPSALGNLTALTSLNLVDNELRSTIPSEMANLTALTSLRLGENDLSGTIPSNLANLTALTSLRLEDNDLSGTIPSTLANLTSLEHIDLSQNNLSGTIPGWLGNLTGLTTLHLYKNQFTGTIPPELGKLIALEELLLRKNQLRGTIPSELGNLTNAIYLNLGSNQLSGAIPSILGNLTKMTSLSLEVNQLSGAIPSELGNLNALLWLKINDNKLSGTIPSNLGNITNIQKIYLANNYELTGEIPSTFTNLSNLNQLTLSNTSVNCDPLSYDPPNQALKNKLDNLFIPFECTNVGPWFSIVGDPSVNEGDTFSITVTLSEALEGSAASVNWITALDDAGLNQAGGNDFVHVKDKQTLEFAAGTTEQTITIDTMIDDLAEPDETFLVLLSDPSSGTLINDDYAIATILGSDGHGGDDGDGKASSQRTEAEPVKEINQALLSHVGSAIMRGNLDGVSSCIDAARSGESDAADMQAMAGSLMGYAAALDADSEQPWHQVLNGMQLNLTKEADADAPGPSALSMCAGSEFRALEGDEGSVSWEGDLYGVNVGGNVRLEDGLIVGVDVSHDRGEFDWRYGAGSAGDWNLTLTGLHPYVAWDAGGDARLWATVGYGSGTLEMSDSSIMDGSQSSDVTEESVAVGGSWPLQTASRSGFSSRLYGEAWSGRFEVEDNGEQIVEVSAQTGGMRGLYEGQWRRAGGSSTLMRFGFQNDSDAGGFGMVGDMGLHWQGQAGLSAGLESRTVLVDGSLAEWDARVDLARAPTDGDEPKLGLSVSQGGTTADISTLWEQGLGSEPDAVEDRGVAFQVEAAWGVAGPADGSGVWTPFTTWSHTGSGVQTLNLGTRLNSRDGHRLELTGSRRDSAVRTADHRVFLRVGLNW